MAFALNVRARGAAVFPTAPYGYVYLTKEDRIRLAHAKGLSTVAFTKKYCAQTDGVYHLKDGDGGQCIFLNEKRCGVYQGRPTQCRTWPFWPEVMSAKIWNKEVAAFCPRSGQRSFVDP
jgi:uncharacterized protein